MRLRRRAGVVRAIAWANLALALVVSGLHWDALPELLTCAAALMAIFYCVAHLLEKRADEVVTR